MEIDGGGMVGVYRVRYMVNAVVEGGDGEIGRGWGF
jgi:hypothetical protein